MYISSVCDGVLVCVREGVCVFWCVCVCYQVGVGVCNKCVCLVGVFVWGRVVDSSVGSSPELISFIYALRLLFRLLVYSIDYRI